MLRAALTRPTPRGLHTWLSMVVAHRNAGLWWLDLRRASRVPRHRYRPLPCHRDPIRHEHKGVQQPMEPPFTLRHRPALLRARSAKWMRPLIALTMMAASITMINSAAPPQAQAAADELMAVAVPVFPLYRRPNALIYRSSIAGMVANPNQIPVWNIEDWRWRS